MAEKAADPRGRAHDAGAAGWLGAIFGARPGVFLICLLAWTLTNMDQALFGYAVPGILQEFGISLQAIGFILTISFAVAAGLVGVAGVAADRFGNGRVLSALLLISAVAVGMQGFAGSIIVLTLFRALGFGFSGGLSPVTNALVAENASARYRGVAMGILQCGYPLGWLVASLGAAPLLAAYGWRAACFLAFLVIPLVIPMAWFLRVRAPSSWRANRATAPATGGIGQGTLATLFGAAYRRRALASSGIFFCFGGAYAGSAFFFPAFFTEARGYSPADAARLVGLSNGIAVFGYLGAALVGEFLLTRRTVFVAWCLGGAVALAALLWLPASHATDLLFYGITAALFFGSQAVIATFVAELFPARVRTGALAVCASAPLSLGFALFPLLVPVAVGALGWPGGFSVVVLPLLVAAGLIALLLPNLRSGILLD